MDVFDRIDTRSKSELFNIIQKAEGRKKEIFISVIKQMFKEIQKTPWILKMHNGDLELLLRKLPPERVEKHLKNDDNAAAELFRLLDLDLSVNTEVISGVLRSLFLLLLHKQEIGEEIYEETVDYMIDAVVLKLFEGVQDK